ncbi:MAG: MASE3 domain-containing protein [Desulfobacteraceae bacterium]
MQDIDFNGNNRDESQKSTGLNSAVNFLVGIVLLLVLFIISRYNYLLFHTVAEFFSIAIAFALFIVVWNSREFVEDTALVFLGIAYLFIGSMDLMHTLVYKAMGVISDAWGADPATQLWIAGRYMESISLCMFAAFWKKRFQPYKTILVYSLVTAIILLSIFYWKNFPNCFIQGIGLTTFKKVSEYMIIGILIAALWMIVKNKHHFDAKFYQPIIFSIVLTIMGELAFTFYVSVYGLSNLIGHYFKILSFFLIYSALIRSNLKEPYRILFLDLHRERQRLKKNQALLESTGRMAKVGGWELDAETLEVTWTGEMYRIHELPPDTKPLLQEAINFFHPGDRPKLEQAIQRALDHGDPYDMEIRFITATGNHLWTRTRCEPEVVQGKVIKLKGTFQDITARKRIEDALRESEARYRTLFETISDAVYVHDVYGKLIDVNTEAYQRLGYTRDEMLKLYVSDLDANYTSIDDVKTKIEPAIKSGPLTILSRHRGKNGLVLDVELIMNVFHRKGKDVFVTVARDITDRLTAEKENEKLIASLNQALAEVKKLSGLLPICSHCKKIRDDKGYWSSIESYISQHSEAEFSHSICQECAKKYYPDIDIYDEM